MRGRHGNTKVFGIGLNKTGTTSWTKAMLDLGYRIGDERSGEMLLGLRRGDYRQLLRFCETGEVFQDIPTCRGCTGRFTRDTRMQDSSAVRDSTEQWYSSTQIPRKCRRARHPILVGPAAGEVHPMGWPAVGEEQRTKPNRTTRTSLSLLRAVQP